MRLRSSKTENKRSKRLFKNWSRKHSAKKVPIENIRGYPVIDLYCINYFSVTDFLTMTAFRSWAAFPKMNYFYIQYSVIHHYGIGNFSVIYFLARFKVKFSVIDLFQNTCESKRFDVYLRGLKTCED